jgi:cell division protein FtsL
MTEKDKKNQFTESKGEQPVNTSSFLRGILDGSLLTRKAVQKQLPFILFLALFGLIYISNRYHADKVRRETQALKTEFGELKARALYTSSELMKMGRQTEVAEYVKKYGLEIKESEVPPKKIIVNRIPGD